MNPVTTAITLNMQLPNIATVSWAVQGDTLSRQIEATLVDGSIAWNPQSGYHGVIRAHKPDGTVAVYDVDETGNPAVTWTGNVATIAIVQQALTVPGTVLMQLEFYDANDARVTTFGWAMNVQPSAVTDNEFLSSDYYNILSLQIAGVLGATGHAPYIDSTTKNWMIWNDETAAYVDSGFSSEGEAGPAPVVTGTSYRYANNNSGTTVPTSWSSTRPATVPGSWAWTETTITFDNDTSTKIYSCAYQGNDGAGSPGSSLPIMDGVATVGTATAYSREDHIHPSDAAKFNTANVASAYDSTATYNIGDLCIHDNQLYRCIFPITTAEAWNSAHWTATTLNDENGGLPLTERKILLIGDSYNYGTGGTSGRGWGYYFDQINGTTSTIIHQNGGGFTVDGNNNASYPNDTYPEVIDQLSASAGYDLIIAQSGWNDAAVSLNPSGASAIKTAVASFISKCRAKWPGCEIIIISSNNDTYCSPYKVGCLNAIADTATANGVTKASRNTYMWLQGTGFNYTDNIHLTDDGYQLLGRYISNYATGWDGDINNPSTFVTGGNETNPEGHITFTNGFTVQWGSVQVGSDGIGSVEYPVSFKYGANVFVTVVGNSQTAVFDARAHNQSLTGFDIYTVRMASGGTISTGAYYCRWFAMGI